MKSTTKTNFFLTFFVSAVVSIFFIVFCYFWGLARKENLINQTALQTYRTALTNYISSKNPHLISVFVGTTCTMQINAESFSIKDGVLSCFALSHEFHIMGAMHSIVIEEIKPGIETITSVLNQPPQEKKQPQNRNERPQIIN